MLLLFHVLISGLGSGEANVNFRSFLLGLSPIFSVPGPKKEAYPAFTALHH